MVLQDAGIVPLRTEKIKNNRTVTDEKGTTLSTIEDNLTERPPALFTRCANNPEEFLIFGNQQFDFEEETWSEVSRPRERDEWHYQELYV